jgi:exonuclease III
LPEQAARIIALDPDLVCLQEVRRSARERWRQALAEYGWPHIAAAVPEPADASDDALGRRPLGVLTAAKDPLVPEPIDGLPWPERALAVRSEGIELVNVHSPISPSPGLAKVLTHEAVHRHLARGAGPRAVCGDLNTPRREHADGRVWTFARTSRGRLRAERGERWDQAELAVIRGLEPYGFSDAFRAVHGLEVRELSYEWPQWGGGYRLDHLVVSAEVEVSRIEYLHAWRQAGLSDHSPLYAELSWPVAARQDPEGGRG